MTSPIADLYGYFDAHGLWSKTLHLRRGDHIHHAGNRDDTIYYVESGTIRSYVVVNDDEEQAIRFAYPGDFYAAIDTLTTGRPTRLYGQALRKCSLRTIRGSRYRRQTRKDPALAAIWQNIVSWMIVGQLDREIDLLTTDPAERYRRVLERSPRLFQEIPAKYIANYLRMTPETLSRLRNNR